VNSRSTVGLFAASIFLNAALLFVLEPMFGKMALPLLGGSAAVWTTYTWFLRAEPALIRLNSSMRRLVDTPTVVHLSVLPLRLSSRMFTGQNSIVACAPEPLIVGGSLCVRDSVSVSPLGEFVRV